MAGMVELLRFLVAARVLAKMPDGTYRSPEAKNHDGTKRYRLRAQITRNADGKTIDAVQFDVQSQPTGKITTRKRGAVARGSERA